MIQIQILVSDLQKGHLGSDNIIRGHQRVFANNSLLKRATDWKLYAHWKVHNETTDMGMVSLCSSCQNASHDMQHDLICNMTNLGLHVT